MIESGDVIKSREISPFILFRVRFCEETSYEMKYSHFERTGEFGRNIKADKLVILCMI